MGSQAHYECLPRGSEYKLLEHNCNNFSDELAQFLCGEGARVPAHILDLPQALSPPLRAAVTALLDRLPRPDQHPLEWTSISLSAYPGPDGPFYSVSVTASDYDTGYAFDSDPLSALILFSGLKYALLPVTVLIWAKPDAVLVSK
ncbi:Desumoylating isopeptidase 1 [Eumeta japonica]|uniref:Desumoylating isopeptidase 1 n=1 Tax=Eumeta variegata TaxID=151549 RepID=A0A4C1XMG0_EUMVA|nr:Desumoylating isopeptidase 1 [Eumeta japonica]